MGRRSYVLLLLVLGSLFITNVWCQSPPAPAPSGDGDDDNEDPFQESWVWCVEDADELDLCKKMTVLLGGMDKEIKHQHSCIPGQGDAETCMQKISKGQAKIGIFDGGEILQASEQYGLVTVRTEVNQVENANYYGVGVVKSNGCPKKLSDLKGKRSCHTGYQRAAGWVLPVSYLIDNKIMPVVSKDPQVNNDIESVKAFFSASCAASNDPKKSICTACKVKDACTEDDLYYDYSGSFRCLVEGSGDIAFTKHSIPSLYAKGGQLAGNWTNLQDSGSYQIVCPKGDSVTCADISKYKDCNFGTAPGHTIMVWGNFTKHEIDEFNELFDSANNNKTFKDLFSGENLLANEFAAGVSSSVAYNGTVKDLLGGLYKNIQDLRGLDSASQTATASHAARMPHMNPSAAVFTAVLLVAAFFNLLYTNQSQLALLTNRRS